MNRSRGLHMSQCPLALALGLLSYLVCCCADSCTSLILTCSETF